MDFESTLETIASTLSSEAELSEILNTVSKFLPENLDVKGMLSAAVSYIPTQIDFSSMLRFLLLFGGCSLLLGLVGRMILGKRSSLNHAVSSAMGILFIYALTIIIYTYKPWKLEDFLSPLPFMIFAGDYIMFIPFHGASVSVLCHEILSLVILAFLVNLLDTIVPKGNGIISWYILRFLTTLLAMTMHFVFGWILNKYLPDFLVTYAPVILLGVLAGTLLLGVLNLVLGAILAIVDPIMGAIYTFFFSNIIGKQMTKAVITTIFVSIVMFLLSCFGYTLVCVSYSALISYTPMAFVMLILWYLLGHVL